VREMAQTSNLLDASQRNFRGGRGSRGSAAFYWLISTHEAVAR
jgi:hypothetical protein